jgi:hypothetical protein
MEACMDVLRYVPVDYLKAVVKGVGKELFFNNPHLNFIPVLGEGGVVRFFYALHRGLKFKVYESGRITLEGSLHKFWNGGRHNHNDFTATGFEDIIMQLQDKFNIEPKHLYISCMEVGVNIVPPVETELLLNHVFMHRRKDIEQRLSSDKGKFHCIEHDKFDIKLYDKARQYQLSGQLLRIELKYTNWSVWRKSGIATLADFIDCDKTPFKTDLSRCWDEVLFFDPTAQIPGKWNEYANLNFWRAKRAIVSRQAFRQHVNRLKELNKNGRNLQNIVSELIVEKLLHCAKT